MNKKDQDILAEAYVSMYRDSLIFENPQFKNDQQNYELELSNKLRRAGFAIETIMGDIQTIMDRMSQSKNQERVDLENTIKDPKRIEDFKRIIQSYAFSDRAHIGHNLILVDLKKIGLFDNQAYLVANAILEYVNTIRQKLGTDNQ